MLKELKVGFLCANSFIKRGNKKTSFFIILVLGLIFMNLIFLPALVKGMMSFFIGFVQDYAYGDIVIEPAEGNRYIENVDNLLQKVRNINGVKEATKRIMIGGSIKYKEKIIGVNIIGLIPSNEEIVSKYPYIVSEGEFLGESSKDEIMIGSIIAGKSSASQIYDSFENLNIGSIVSITYNNGVEKNYKVKGIHESSAEITDLNVLVHYKELESILGEEIKNKASVIIIRIQNPGEEYEIKKKIIESGVKEKVFTWQEKSEVIIKQAIQSMGSFGIMSKVISLIIGASLIFIIIYINTLNRKKEIGILRAIGISSKTIIISYILISSFYVIIGIALGLSMFIILSIYLQNNPIVLYETIKIYPIINYFDLIANGIIMIIIGLIAGFIPAWLVTKQDILKSIWGT
ncbi:MAG: FtsX-like permease family protein [Candidatus Pacearchaeota archaeon]